MARRASWLAALVLGGCTGDVTGVGEGQVRAVVISGVTTIELIEYSAPPIRALRHLTLNGGNSFVQPMVRDPVRGGFYAMAAQGSLAGALAPGAWSVVRYGADWTIAATRSGVELVGTDSLVTYFLRLTPDGRYLVTEVFSPPGAAHVINDLLVLDAATLELIDRRPMGLRQLYTGFGPPGTTGSQILFLAAVAPGCVAAVWVDVAGDITQDSVGVPCDYSFRGALSPRRLYLYPLIDELPQRLLLWDPSGAGLAEVESARPPLLLPDPARNRLVGLMGSTVMLLDAQTLAVHRVIPLHDVPGSPAVVIGVVDRGTGALFAIVDRTRRCRQGICPHDAGLMVIDLDNGAVLAELDLENGGAIVP